MAIQVDLITSLRHEAGMENLPLEIKADSISECLNQIRQSRPPLYRCVCDETGKVRRHIAIFVNDALLPPALHHETRLEAGDRVSIMTAVSGG